MTVAILLVGIVAVTSIGLKNFTDYRDYRLKYLTDVNQSHFLFRPERFPDTAEGKMEEFYWNCVDKGEIEGCKKEITEKDGFRVTVFRNSSGMTIPVKMLIFIEYLGDGQEEFYVHRPKLAWYEGDEELSYSTRLDDVNEKECLITVDYANAVTRLKLEGEIHRNGGYEEKSMWIDLPKRK